MSKRLPYEERTDLEKIRSQWKKVTGSLHTDEQWSAAIVRAATAAELAANFAIRKEFKLHSQFDDSFVSSLLRWANGLSGKVDRLILPLTEGMKKHSTIKSLKGVADQVNRERNAVVHQGHFRNSKQASVTIEQARKFVETLVRLYEPDFRLKPE